MSGINLMDKRREYFNGINGK